MQRTPAYTFVSVSTARPGQLDRLVEIARLPSEKMDGVPGLIARQVSVDRSRNTVVVWTTFDRKETLYDDLEAPALGLQPESTSEGVYLLAFEARASSILRQVPSGAAFDTMAPQMASTIVVAER